MLATTTETRTEFKIPEANLPRLRKEVAKLSKKAVKFGGWEFDLVIYGIDYRDNGDGTKTAVYTVSLDVMPIKIGDWTFVARIDHSQETGNIVRAVPNSGHKVEERFRHTAPNCEHCNHRRMRRDTFVLYNNETGEEKQVGSTCLVDFLGHDAANLGRVAEFAGYATEAARAFEARDTPRSLKDVRYVGLPEYLRHVAASIRQKGWISGKTAYENGLDSTKSMALWHMFGEEEITQDDIELADNALEWAQSLADKSSLNDYEHNVLVIANSSVIEARACGIAASIVGVYRTKHTERAKAVTLENMEPLLALFAKAGSKLKNPRITIDLPGVGAVELTVAKPHHKVPGSINVKAPGYGSAWFGRILTNGAFQPSRMAPQGLDKGLLALAADPAAMAAQHGHKTGQCCFCNLPLKDDRSLSVGYGKTCATNYQLPWGKK